MELSVDDERHSLPLCVSVWQVLANLVTYVAESLQRKLNLKLIKKKVAFKYIWHHGLQNIVLQCT